MVRALFLVVVLALSSSVVHAQEPAPATPMESSTTPDRASRWRAHQSRAKPPWRQRRGLSDVTMLLTQRLPLASQAATLAVVDLMAPVLLAAPAAVLGGAVGFGVGMALSAVPDADGTYTLQAGPLAFAGAATGAVLLGALITLLGDVVLNTLHLEHLVAARLVGLLVTGLPAALVLLSATVALPIAERSHRGTALVLESATSLSPMYGGLLLPPLAVVLSLAMRLMVDYDEGSPLWEASPHE